MTKFLYKKYLFPIFQIHFNAKNISKHIYNISFYIKLDINSNSKENNILNDFAFNFFFKKNQLYFKSFNKFYYFFNLKDINILNNNKIFKDNYCLFLKHEIKNNKLFLIKNLHTALKVRILYNFFREIRSSFYFYIKYSLDIKYLKLFLRLI